MIRTTLAAVGVMLVCAVPVAFADTYDYAIDRFEADGNVHGAKDGTPDLVEEFDDGTMGPLFGPTAGTTLEAGGALHLKSPGAQVAIPGVTPTAFETSAVVSTGFTGLQVGGGDAVFRIVLPPQTIGGNDGVNGVQPGRRRHVRRAVLATARSTWPPSRTRAPARRAWTSGRRGSTASRRRAHRR
jgi:hypothetical protein